MYTLLDNNYKITKGKENFAYEEVKSLFPTALHSVQAGLWSNRPQQSK